MSFKSFNVGLDKNLRDNYMPNHKMGQFEDMFNKQSLESDKKFDELFNKVNTEIQRKLE